MTYRLLIQPFDAEFDFLEDIGNQSKVVYESKIKTFEVLPRVQLPSSALTQKNDWASQFFIENIVTKLSNSEKAKIKRHYESGKKLVYENDILDEMTRHWAYNSNEIFLGVLPYLVYGLMDAPNGQAERGSHLAVISNFDIKSHNSEVSVGIGLHEIGHVLSLDHCKAEECLMRRPGRFKDFYEGVYKLCEFHERQVSNPNL